MNRYRKWLNCLACLGHWAIWIFSQQLYKKKVVLIKYLTKYWACLVHWVTFFCDASVSLLLSSSETTYFIRDASTVHQYLCSNNDVLYLMKLHVSILWSTDILEKTEVTLNKQTEKWRVKIPSWLTYWFSPRMIKCPETLVSALDVPSAGAITGSLETVLLLFWLNKWKFMEFRVSYHCQIWLDMDNDFKNGRILSFSWKQPKSS